MSLHELRDALAQPACAVCRIGTGSSDRFVESLLWEGVNDPQRRDEIRQAQGFCHKHAWSLVRTGASLGTAIITRDVLQNALRIIEGTVVQATPVLSLRRVRDALTPRRPAAATAEVVARLEPQTTCSACLWAEKMEGMYLESLLTNLLGEGGLLTAYEASDGLCLPHFRRAMRQARDEKVLEALVSAQRTIWKRLIYDLSEFARKSDHRFQDEEWGEEKNAWIRALAALVGAHPDRDLL